MKLLNYLSSSFDGFSKDLKSNRKKAIKLGKQGTLY